MTARARIAGLAAGLFAWLLAVPLAFAVPKDRRLIAVIGREDGRFSDNAKYFCLQAWSGAPGRGYRVVFLTEDAPTLTALRASGAPVLRWPSLHAAWCLLRAAAVVADSVEWTRRARFQFAFRAKRIQLWHGVPLKRIELDHLAGRLKTWSIPRRALFGAYYALAARYPHYDLFLSTSRAFTERAFARSFKASRIVEAGYPRNAALSIAGRDALGDRVWLNTDTGAARALRAAREAGARVVLYAPTFRTHGANALDPGIIDWSALDDFARSRGLCVLLKLHPLLAGSGRLDGFDHIVEYDARCDVYPLLAEVDLLVTDYSSIYFDFLLLDRPIVFFPYDLEDYQRAERGLLFRYDEVTPGPTARNRRELHAHVDAALAPGGDRFAAQRRALRALAFDHPEPDAGLLIWPHVDRILGAAGSG